MALGRYTGVDLGAITPLTMPWHESNRVLMPDFSQAAAQLSLELAATAYDFETAPWREAGWYDISYLADGQLFTGPSVNGETEKGFSPALAARYQKSAAALITKQSPIVQLRGAWRQREGSNACKCLVMIHRSAPGRYIVAIGFMGTGKRVHDWLPNFRMEPEEGAHRGFLALAREFEAHQEAILFPQTARELGLERLTLAELLAQCRRPGSPFRIWMAGHSQGGAIMQLAARREIARGMLRQCLIGYGFASPTVLYGAPCPTEVPLYHIINADDPVPRVGAQFHVGHDRVYCPDISMRSICYAQDAVAPAAFSAARQIIAMAGNSSSAQLFFMAFLTYMGRLPEQEAAAIMQSVVGKLLPEKLYTALGGRTGQPLRQMLRRAEQSYRSMAEGTAPPPGLLSQWEARISQLAGICGTQAALTALLQAMALPHRLRQKGSGPPGAYQYIVCSGFSHLRPCLFSGRVPHSPCLPVRSGTRRRLTRRCPVAFISLHERRKL